MVYPYKQGGFFFVSKRNPKNRTSRYRKQGANNNLYIGKVYTLYKEPKRLLNLPTRKLNQKAIVWHWQIRNIVVTSRVYNDNFSFIFYL